MNDVKRRIILESRCSLSVNDGMLQIERNEDTSQLSFDTIESLCFAARLHSSLDVQVIQECLKRGIQLMFEDEKHQVNSQIHSLYGTNDTSGKIKKQTSWEQDRKKQLTIYILKNKIVNQESVLTHFNLDTEEVLSSYPLSLEEDPDGNKEGIAARIYFSRLFGHHFDRRMEGNLNAMLNYGYALLASRITQSIVGYGYLTQIGIHHCSNTNPFNLTYDFIEPFRPLVDRYVYLRREKEEFTYADKKNMLSIMDEIIHYGKQKWEVGTAIDVYVLDCLKYMNWQKNLPKEISL